MTSLSRKKETTIEIPEDGESSGIDLTARLPDPDTKPEDIVWVKIYDKEYPFTKEMIRKYPKLLDSDVLFLLHFESILPIIYGYPASCIPEDLLNDPSEKQTFLCNAEFLGVELSDAMILHLSSQLRQEVKESSEAIRKKLGYKVVDKNRVAGDQRLVTFAAKHARAFREACASVPPLEILMNLATGESQLLDEIVIEDFKSKNLISSFIKSFRGYVCSL